jgi:aminopeptidase N
MIELPDIRNIVLANGAHDTREQGVCLLEAVAWFAGLPHSDHPECTDVALAAFGRSLNDRLKDDERQALRDLVPSLVGTKGSPELAKRRAYLLVDRHVRTVWPAFFRELPTPREEWAKRFESVPSIVDVESANAATEALRAVRDEARKARDDAWSKLTAGQRSDAAAAAYAAAAAAADAAYAAAYAADADAAYAADAAAAYAADAAYAAAYAADAAYAAAYAAAVKEPRKRTIERSIAAYVEAIELTEAS